MSEKEFEQGNEELFSVVNDHAAPEAAAQAEKIEEQLKKEPEKEPVQNRFPKQDRAARWIKWKFRLRMIGRILLCILVAALFTVALVDNRFVPVLCYTGLVACVSILSILIDRNTRGW